MAARRKYDRLTEAFRRAAAWPRVEPVASLRRMLGSSSPSQRLLALLLMQRQLRGGQPRTYLAMARRAIDDPNNTCRWQALIAVSEFIQSDPEAVWRVASRYAESPLKDMRVAVTVLLLEHLLEEHFDVYFPKVERRIRHGSRYLRLLLPGCWGLSKEQEARVKAVLRDPTIIV